MPEFFKNPIEQKTDLEKINSFINTFVVERKNLKQEFNKKELFDSVQEEWLKILEKENFLNELNFKKPIKELIADLCLRINQTKVVFASSPKIYELLSLNKKGFECLSASIALGSVLDKKNIPYDFISPVGHIALSVNIDNQNYYVDPRNNKILNLEQLVESEINQSQNFDLVKLKENRSKYSFFFKYKNKEDIMKAVFDNIIVLNNLNHNKTEGASTNLVEHQKFAKLLKNDLDTVDFKVVKNFVHENYDSFYERNKDLIAEEEKRVYNK